MLDTDIVRGCYLNMQRAETFAQMPDAVNWTFASGDMATLGTAKKYVDNWDAAYANGTGLMMFGDVRTGKTYAAACIANALIDRGASVMITTAPGIVASLSGCKSDGWHSYLQQVANADLLIIDDLGAERCTDYAQERIYVAVDQRVATGKPMLVTTNIPPALMREITDMRLQRIYAYCNRHGMFCLNLKGRKRT